MILGNIVSEKMSQSYYKLVFQKNVVVCFSKTLRFFLFSCCDQANNRWRKIFCGICFRVSFLGLISVQ